MKTLMAGLALVAALAMGGKAMACGGGAGGKLGRLTIQKVYRNVSPSVAARRATAYSMTRTLAAQDSSAPMVSTGMLKAKMIKKTAATKLYDVTVHDKDQEVTGEAKVSVAKIAKGLKVTVR